MSKLEYIKKFIIIAVLFFIFDAICYFAGASLNLAEKASYWYLPAGALMAGLILVKPRYYVAIFLSHILTHGLWTYLGMCQMMIKWTGLYTIKMVILFICYSSAALLWRKISIKDKEFQNITSVFYFIILMLTGVLSFELVYGYINYMSEINYNKIYASIIGDLAGVFYVVPFALALKAHIEGKDYKNCSYVIKKETRCDASRDFMMALFASVLFFVSSEYSQDFWAGSQRIMAFIPLLVISLTRGWKGVSVAYFLVLPVFCACVYYSDYADKYIVSAQLSNIILFIMVFIIGVMRDINEKLKNS